MVINKEKLKWRSRRSMLELDIFFDRFIQNNGLEKLTEVELYAYQNILTLDDGYLLLLLQGNAYSNDEIEQIVIDKIMKA